MQRLFTQPMQSRFLSSASVQISTLAGTMQSVATTHANTFPSAPRMGVSLGQMRPQANEMQIEAVKESLRSTNGLYHKISNDRSP
jgi:hypothetical protein